MVDSGDIFLRRVDTRDVDRLFSWENRREFWAVSDRKEPLTRSEIELFVEEQAADVFDLDQIRWMIESKSNGVVGTIDLYEINWETDTACIGILVAAPEFRKKNIGTEALGELLQLSAEKLELERLISRIQPHNDASIALFSKLGFLKIIPDLGDGNQQADYLQYHTFELWLKK